MASVFDVAKYIVGKLGATTTMKLQKLTYYCQAWSLAWDGVPLFEEEFQAWANGPVCPELYNMHRGIYSVDEDFFSGFKRYDFSDSEIETMNTVLDYYGDKEPHWLSELTHKEAPWREARRGIPAGERSSVIISKPSMQAYYEGLL